MFERVDYFADLFKYTFSLSVLVYAGALSDVGMLLCKRYANNLCSF